MIGPIKSRLSDASGPHAAWLHELIYQVKPPPYADVPSEIMDALPTFDARELLVYPFTEPYQPPVTPPLARRPPQSPCTDCSWRHRHTLPGVHATGGGLAAAQ